MGISRSKTAGAQRESHARSRSQLVPRRDCHEKAPFGSSILHLGYIFQRRAVWPRWSKKQFAKMAGLCREQMPGTLTFRVSEKHHCASFQTVVALPNNRKVPGLVLQGLF
ncbi:unnamed protein product [Effrenium voratum]|nr:unnamed protein product [Effrenium voratum]